MPMICRALGAMGVPRPEPLLPLVSLLALAGWLRTRRGKGRLPLDRLAAVGPPSTAYGRGGPHRPEGDLDRCATAGSQVLMAIGGGLGAWFLARVLLGPGWLDGAAVVAAAAVPGWYRLWRTDHRRRELRAQALELALCLHGSASAGMTPLQGLQAAVATSESLRRSPWTTLLAEARAFGLAEALATLRERAPVAEVRLLAAALRLQLTVGTTAEGLSTVVHALRQRQRWEAAVRAAVAGVRAEAELLLAVPAAVVVLLRLLAPWFVSPLLTGETGRWLVLGALGWTTMGWLSLRGVVLATVRP